MLDKIISFIGILMLIFFTVFCCVALYVGMVKWFQLQNEANLIADGMAQYGGYTNVLNEQLQDFCTHSNFNPSDLTVTVNPTSGPAPYGQKMSVNMSYPFNQAINISLFSSTINLPMTVTASSLSHYLENEVTGSSPVQINYSTPSP